MTQATLTASLGEGQRERQLRLRDAAEPLNRLWDIITQYSVTGLVPVLQAPPSLPPPGKRRRGVTDAPPMRITREDYDLITISDPERLREIVFEEPKLKGRMGRPPRSYRVPAEQWGPAYRLFALVFPDIAASWSRPQPWWAEAQQAGD